MHADAGVLGAEHLDEELLLEVEPAVERDVEPAVDGPLGQALGRHRAGGQLGRPVEGPVEDGLGGHDLVDQAHGQRLVGPHLAAGEDQVLGPGRADQPGEALGAAAARDDAEQDLGLARAWPSRWRCGSRRPAPARTRRRGRSRRWRRWWPGGCRRPR